MKSKHKKLIAAGLAVGLAGALAVAGPIRGVLADPAPAVLDKTVKVEAMPMTVEEETLVSKLLSILTGWYIDPKDKTLSGGFSSNLGSQKVDFIDETETEEETFGIDFENVKSLEKALQAAGNEADPEEALEKLVGKSLEVEAKEAEEDEDLGYVMSLSDHVKLVNDDDPGLDPGEEAVIRIDSVEKKGEDYLVRYSLVDAETGEKLTPSPTTAPVGTETPTPTQKPTSAPTNTPVPTEPSKPTAAPIPTATPVPTATPIPLPPNPTPTPIPAPKPVSITGQVNGTHYIGDTLSAGDLTVRVTMSDGTVLTNPAGYSASPLTLSSASNVITLTYGGISGQITVTATSKPVITLAPIATPTPVVIKQPTNTPTPIPTTAPVSGDSGKYRGLAEEIFNAQNQHRTSKGLPALTWDESMYELAYTRAVESGATFAAGGQSNYLEHAHDGIRQCNGENGAYSSNSKSAQFYMERWLASEGHLKNIESTAFTKCSVGVYQDPSNGYYFIMVLFRTK